MKLSRKCMAGLLAVWSFALLVSRGNNTPSSAVTSPITEETLKQTSSGEVSITEDQAKKLL